MSDLMLKQFEAWTVIDNQYSIARTYTDLRYDEDDTEAAWDAWQSSRECLVIELPDRFDEHYQDYYEDVDGGCFNEGRYINDVHAALTAAGVKTK